MAENRDLALTCTWRDRQGRPYLVRPARPADGPMMVELLNRVGAEQVYIADDAASLTAEEESRLIERHNPDLQCILVAEQEQRLAGSLEMIRGAVSKNRHTALFGMALFPEFRGRQIGRGLLAVAEIWAESVGVEKISLAVFATNHQAQALYRALGYVEEGRRRGQYRILGQAVDEVWMAKWLNPPTR